MNQLEAFYIMIRLSEFWSSGFRCEDVKLALLPPNVK